MRKAQHVALQILAYDTAQPISLYKYFLKYEPNIHYQEKKVVALNVVNQLTIVFLEGILLSLNTELTANSTLCLNNGRTFNIYWYDKNAYVIWPSNHD